MKLSRNCLPSIHAILAAGSIGFAAETSAGVNDVSTSVEQLGNPVNAVYPGAGLASLEDLQLFGKKIFLGYGTLNNVVPKAALYLDPVSRLFHTDYPGTVLNDEILRRFRVFGNEMYVESFDPISNLSNLYLRQSGGWRIRGMDFPGSGRHNFDIYKFGNALFTGGGFGFPGIAMSFNGGTNWILPGQNVTNAVFYDPEFFEFNGKLYVSQDLSYSKFFTNVAAPFLLRYSGSTNMPFTNVHVLPSNFYPAGDLNEGKLSHFEKLRGRGAFIGNGALYVATSIEPPSINKAILPNSLGDFVVDLLARTNGIYFLASQPQPANAEFPFLGVIGKSEDLQTWVEICRFGARETVQSFEAVDGDFYVGLGNYLTATNPHSGDVLRIPKLAANEQRSIVIPANLEFTNGRAGNNYPFGLGNSVRYQQVYLNSAFASVAGPQLITHLAFRPFYSGGQAFTNTVQNLRIDLSTTPASPTALSAQFAANVGSDVSMVFTGAVTLASTYAPGSPKAFEVEIALQKPFFYDPAQGNLLMDIRNHSGSLCAPLDITWGSGLPSARVVSASGGVANLTGVADASPTCLVTKFKMLPTTLTNRPPLVFAGPGQSVTLPNSALLGGTANDEGLPSPPAAVTSLWSKVSGPGSVTFGNSQTLTTAAEFSAAGIYVLRLSAGDGELSAASDVTISVKPVPPVNLAPVVSAGDRQTIAWKNQAAGITNTASLNGLIADDGYPQVPGVVTSLWTKVSGPGTVYFAAASAPLTLARFSNPGEYVLRLVGGDGEFVGSDQVIITVNAESDTNQAPTANAGPDLTGTQLKPVNLKGWMSDDGLPSPPASCTAAWTKLAGPGAVQFGTAAPTTTAMFSAPGKYALRLTVSDGSAQSIDDVIVDVLDGMWAVVPGSLSNANGKAGNSIPFNLAESVRCQQVYAASQFASNQGPYLITEVAFRPSAFSGNAFTSSLANVVIELSTTSASPASGLAANFAENVGADRKTVFSGRLDLSSRCVGSGPREFDVIIPLQRAFLYDPRNGNLLLDVRNISGGTTTFLDLTWGNGLPSSRLASRAGGVNDAEGLVDATATALATRFTLGRVPPPRMTLAPPTGLAVFQFESVSGQRVVVEASNDLVNWTAVSTNTSSTEAIPIATPSNTGTQRFYRGYITR